MLSEFCPPAPKDVPGALWDWGFSAKLLPTLHSICRSSGCTAKHGRCQVRRLRNSRNPPCHWAPPHTGHTGPIPTWHLSSCVTMKKSKMGGGRAKRLNTCHTTGIRGHFAWSALRSCHIGRGKDDPGTTHKQSSPCNTRQHTARH